MVEKEKVISLSKPEETKCRKSKLVLDSRYQKYVSDEFKDFLKVNAINKRNIISKTFGSNKGKSKEFGEFQFVVNGFNSSGLRLYISGFGVLVVCDSMKEHRVVPVFCNSSSYLEHP